MTLCRGISGLLLFASVLVPAASPLFAADVRLTHNATPGALTVYDIELTTRRTIIADQVSEEPAWVQTGTLTCANLSGNHSGKFSRVQMLQLIPADPSPTAQATEPSASQPFDWMMPLRLPGGTSLTIDQLDDGTGAYRTPLETTVSGDMLSLLMPPRKWPQQPLSPAGVYDETVKLSFGTFRRNFRLEKVRTRYGERQAIIKLDVEAVSGDQPSEDDRPRFQRGAASLAWSVSNDDLAALQAEISWEEPLRIGRLQEAAELAMMRTTRRTWSKGMQDIERAALVDLANAIHAERRNDPKQAFQIAGGFLAGHPNSVWFPMARELHDRLNPDRAGLEPVPFEKLNPMLVRLIALWTRAEAEEDQRVRQLSEAALAHLAEVNRPEIRRLMDDEDAAVRKLGTFALAFGKAPADVALIQKMCADPDTSVRRTALVGLTMRASPLTDPDRIIPCIADQDEEVRLRACEALGACGSTKGERREKVLTAIRGRLDDDSLRVVLAAAEVLLLQGNTEDRALIESRASSAKPSGIRSSLRRLLDLPVKTGTLE